MTDNEIIKALECCSVDPSSGKYADCKNCPLDILDSANCFWFVIQKNALDLINRQKAEIERLKTSRNDDRHKFCNLIGNVLVYSSTLEDYNNFRKEIKAAAVGEFVERFRKLSEYGTINISPWQLDNIAKEMVGESNG